MGYWIPAIRARLSSSTFAATSNHILTILLIAGWANSPPGARCSSGITLSDSIQIGSLTFIGLLASVGVAYVLYVTAVPKRLSKIHQG